MFFHITHYHITECSLVVDISDFEKGCIRKTLLFKIIVAAAAKIYMTSNFSSRVSQSVISVILVLMLNQAPIHNSQDNLWSAGRGETQFWLLQFPSFLSRFTICQDGQLCKYRCPEGFLFDPRDNLCKVRYYHGFDKEGTQSRLFKDY